MNKAKLFFNNVLSILKDALQGFGKHNATKLSGSLAYSTIFSLPPMLLLVIIFGGFFYGQDALSGRIFIELKDLIGADTALQVQNIIKQLQFQDGSGLATIISAIALIIGATGVFVEIQGSLNLIWGVKSKPKKGILKLILDRFLSFSMILSLGFIMIVSLVLNTIVTALSTEILSFFPELPVDVISFISNVVLFFVLSFLFSFIFKVLPDVKLKWREIWPGAFLTTLLFMLGKYGISLYISTNNTITLYGAASSVIILLVWVYFSSFILYFGAEFTRAYIESKGGKIIPSQYAEYDDQRKWDEYIHEQ